MGITVQLAVRQGDSGGGPGGTLRSQQVAALSAGGMECYLDESLDQLARKKKNLIGLTLKEILISEL